MINDSEPDTGEGMWMSPLEAAHELCTSVDSVYRQLVKWAKKPTPNKIRCLELRYPGDQRAIRLYRNDVSSMVPARSPNESLEERSE